MDTKRSIVWRYFVDCRKAGDNTVECKSCVKRYAYQGNTTNMFRHIKDCHPHLYNQIVTEEQRMSVLERSGLMPSGKNEEDKNCVKRYAYQGNTTNMFHHIRTYHPHLYSEILTEQHRVSVLESNSLISSNKNEEDRNKKHTAPGGLLDTSDVEIKPESVTETYRDGYFTPLRSDDSFQEPWTSVAASTGAVVNTSGLECSLLKRKRTESDVSRMISSISFDIQSLVDRSVNSSDAHFYQSVAFEVEKLDEDAKDLVKAAVWQIIYKVKSAKKRNVDLCLEDIFK